MIAAILPLLWRLVPSLAGGLALWFVWMAADSWCNGACQDAQTGLSEALVRAETAEGNYAAAVQRASALALLWAKEVDNVKVRYVEVERKRTEDFAAVRERSGAIRSGVLVPLDAPTVGVLVDAERLANGNGSSAAGGGESAPAAVPVSPRDTTVDEWRQFAVDAAEAYADARGKWAACVAYADSIKQEPSNAQDH